MKNGFTVQQISSQRFCLIISGIKANPVLKREVVKVRTLSKSDYSEDVQKKCKEMIIGGLKANQSELRDLVKFVRPKEISRKKFSKK